MSLLIQLGIVDVTVGILLCAVASAIGVVLFFRARPGIPVETRAWEIQTHLAPTSTPVTTSASSAPA